MPNRLINVAKEKYSNLCDTLKFKINDLFKRANCWVVVAPIDTYGEGKRKVKSARFQYALQALDYRAEMMNRKTALIYYYDAQKRSYSLWY